jgi:hypothetical protein
VKFPRQDEEARLMETLQSLQQVQGTPQPQVSDNGRVTFLREQFLTLERECEFDLASATIKRDRSVTEATLLFKEA